VSEDLRNAAWRHLDDYRVGNGSGERSCRDIFVSVTTKRKSVEDTVPVLEYCCLLWVTVTHCQLNVFENQKL